MGLQSIQQTFATQESLGLFCRGLQMKRGPNPNYAAGLNRLYYPSYTCLSSVELNFSGLTYLGIPSRLWTILMYGRAIRDDNLKMLPRAVAASRNAPALNTPGIPFRRGAELAIVYLSKPASLKTGCRTPHLEVH